MPTVQQVLLEKKNNFVKYTEQLAKDYRLEDDPIYLQHHNLISKLDIDEFIYFISSQIQPFYLKDEIPRCVHQFVGSVFGTKVEIKKEDLNKIERYLILFVKLINS